MKKLFEKIDLWATRKNTIIAFILWAVNGILLTYTDELLKTFSTVPKLDFHLFGYNADYVNNLLGSYGEEGRQAYLWMTVLDVPLPFVACLFCSLLYANTYKQWGVKWLGNTLICFSISFLIFDNLENACIFLMLGNYPLIPSWLADSSSILTQIKLVSVIIIYSFLPITLIVWAVRFLIKKYRTSFH